MKFELCAILGCARASKQREFSSFPSKNWRRPTFLISTAKPENRFEMSDREGIHRTIEEHFEKVWKEGDPWQLGSSEYEA